MEVTIYHNTRCSKSRGACDILAEKKVKVKVKEYLKKPPTEKELKSLLKKLGLKAEDLVRKSEELFENKFSKKKYSETEWIKIMVKNPILIQRPIVVKGDKAIIARPPEKVLEFLK